MERDPEAEQQASRLKAIAETKFENSNLKAASKYARKAQSLAPNLEGISSMVTAFDILLVGSNSMSKQPPLSSSTSSSSSAAADGYSRDWYKILQVEPFSHINTIKKQYKKLALVLHPDKNPHVGSEEAFKLVGEGFRVLSDKVRRKEYDTRLRLKILNEKALVNDEDGLVGKDTFWTVCSLCRLFHQFERKYLGQNLICPSCKKSFKAVEVDRGSEVRVSQSETLSRNAKTGNVGLKRKMVSGSMGKKDGEGGDSEKDMGVRARLRRRTSSVGEVLARSKSKIVDDVEESLTLAEIQLEAKRRANQVKLKLRQKDKETEEHINKEKEIEERGNKEKETEERINKEKEIEECGDKEKEIEECGNNEKEVEECGNKEKVIEECGNNEKEIEECGNKEKERENNGNKEKEIQKHKGSGRMDFETEGQQVAEKSGALENETPVIAEKIVHLRTKKRRTMKNIGDLQIVRQGTRKKSAELAIVRGKTSKTKNLEIMTVEDSDFYDFDRDRVERSFKKGQVWAIYDDDDGMPRHYGLVDEVVSVNPFEVKISWLDIQNNGDEGLLCWEKQGFHVACGRFKVSRKTSIDSLNIFSHVVDCERAARELYRIYPKKGSVWALYNEAALGVEGRNLSARDRRSYDIVVFLTSYSEIHGLSMAYLEKADGFRAVFKRREIGCHAIRWLEKDDVRLFSHQIPARKLMGDEIPDSSWKDCWELDPASLPSELLTIGWGR